MVTRQYEGTNIRGPGPVSPQQYAVQGGDYRPVQAVSVGDVDWRDRFIQQVGGEAVKVLNKAADTEYANLYLEGASKAGVIESEDELEGNPLTRDWKVAGYRDTMGKLSLADAEASFAVDVKTLREKNPEELQAYLAERRNKILPQLGSMSSEGRKATVGQLYLLDKAATKQYTAERAKFIIEQKSQAIHTPWNTTNQLLSQAQVETELGTMPPEVFQEKIRSAVGTITTSVWMDNSLPTEVKKQLTFEMLQTSLANDNVALYEFLQANPVIGADGSPSNVIGRLTGEQQLKLSNDFRAAMQRTSDARGLYRMEQLATVQAQIDAGQYTGDYNSLNNLLRPMVLNKTIDAGTYRSTLNAFLDKQLQGEKQTALAEMTLRGDLVGLRNAGASNEDALKSVEGLLARQKASPEQHLTTWLTVGLNGNEGGFKKAGEFLGATMRQIAMSKDGNILSQHKELFETVNAAARRAEGMGLNNTRSRILSGLPEDDRAFAEQVFNRIDKMGLDGAVEAAKDMQAKDALLTPAARAAVAQATTQQLATQIKGMEPIGLIGAAWASAKAAFGSADAAADLALRPRSYVGDRDGWFSNSPTVQAYTERVRTEMLAEATSVASLRPSASADEVLSIAKANVASRVIDTTHGPVILPKGTDLQAVFGVGPGNQAAIGKAISGMLQPTVEDSRYFVTFQQGRMFAQEYDNKGAAVGHGKFFDPSAVRAKITEDTNKEVEQADRVFGTGRVVKADGVAIRYSGENTAGVPGLWMYGFRDNLIAHEGVRGQAYKDLSGNKDKDGKDIQTVGVGVSSTNTYFPALDAQGRVSSAATTKSFLDASNEAAQAGSKLARSIGRNNQFAFQFLSEVAYQSGPGFASREDSVGEAYREVLTHMKAGDADKAKEAFKKTPAWRYSLGSKGESKRNRSYITLIENSLK